MKITEIGERTPQIVEKLLSIWEKSQILLSWLDLNLRIAWMILHLGRLRL